MLHLALRLTRRRLAALLALALTAFGGAALLSAAGVLAESGLRSHLPAGRLAGADVVVTAPQTLDVPGELSVALPERARVDRALVTGFAHLPGVRAAVGDRSLPAALIGADGSVVTEGDPAAAGHAWSSLAVSGPARVQGSAPTGTGQVALARSLADAAGVHRGSAVRIASTDGTRAYRVSAVVDAGVGVLFPDPVAARLARTSGGAVDLVAVRLQPGADTAAVRTLARQHGLTVSTGDHRGDATSPGAAAASGTLLALAGSLSGVLLLVVGFLTAGVVSVSVAAQRRELALLRSVGATPRQVRRLASHQALTVTAVAALPGALLGGLLADRLRGLLVDGGLLPPELALTHSPLPALVSLLLLGLTVVVAAQAATRRTSRLPAVGALVESRAERRTSSELRTGAGLLLIVAATTMAALPLFVQTAVASAATPIAGITAAIGLALAGPELVRRAADGLARRLPSGSSASTWLAVANVRGYAVRSAGAVSTLAMVVVLVPTYAFAPTTLAAAVSGQVRAATPGAVAVTAPGLGGLPADVLPAVRATPGVRGATAVRATTVFWPYRQLGDVTMEAEPALALRPDAAAAIDLGVRSGSLRDLHGATVAVAADTTGPRHARLGGQVPLVLGDGHRVRARVVAVYDRGLGFGPVVLSRDLARGHTTSDLDQQLVVRTDGSAATRDRLAAIAARHPGVDLGSPAAASSAQTDAVTRINVAVLAVLLGYVLLGVANKLVAAAAQRRGEITTLRLLGATPRQVRAVLRTEAAVVAALAVAAGLALCAAPLGLLGLGFLHRPWPAGPAWLVPATVAVVVAMALLTTQLPTRRALRAPAAAGREQTL